MRNIYYFILVAMGIIGISSCSQDDYTLLNEVGNQSETSS